MKTQGFQAEIDAQAVRAALDRLSLTRAEAKKAVNGAIRKSLSVVRSSVRRGAAKVTSDREKQMKLVKLAVYKRIFGGKVDITSVEYLSKGNHRGRAVFGLFWLERGTNEVIGRDGRRHGATPPKPFFEAAVSMSMPRAQSMLSDNILAYIDKVAARRK